MSSQLKATARQDKGKGASRRLRRENMTPGIIYGADKDPLSISMVHDDLYHAAEKESFYSQILEIDVDGTIEKVVAKDMQRHVYKPMIQHVDFLRIDENKKLRTHVPIHCINEDACIGTKKGGLITHDMIEIEIACLPKNLPEFIEVDVTDLDVGSSLHLSELKLPEGVEVPELNRGHDQSVVSVAKVRGGAADDEESGEAADEAGEE